MQTNKKEIKRNHPFFHGTQEKIETGVAYQTRTNHSHTPVTALLQPSNMSVTYEEEVNKRMLASLYMLAHTAEMARVALEEERKKMQEKLHQELYDTLMDMNQLVQYRANQEWKKFLTGCEEMDTKLTTLLKKGEETPGLLEQDLETVVRRWKELNQNNIFIARVSMA